MGNHQVDRVGELIDLAEQRAQKGYYKATNKQRKAHIDAYLTPIIIELIPTKLNYYPTPFILSMLADELHSSLPQAYSQLSFIVQNKDLILKMEASSSKQPNFMACKKNTDIFVFDKVFIGMVNLLSPESIQM